MHTVFLDTLLRQCELFDTPLLRADQERLFVEWYEAALFLGLRDRDLPHDLKTYRARFEYALQHEVECTSVTEFLLADSQGPPPPPALRWLTRPVWQALSRPLVVSSRWLTLACLPPTFRDRLADRHPWTSVDEARFSSLRAGVRGLVSRLPEASRLLPDAKRVRAARLA